MPWKKLSRARITTFDQAGIAHIAGPHFRGPLHYRCPSSLCKLTRAHGGLSSAPLPVVLHPVLLGGAADMPRPRLMITFRGQQVPLTDLAKQVGISASVLRERWNAGYRGEDLARPVNYLRKGRRKVQEGEEGATPPKRVLPPDPRFTALVRAWNLAVFGVTD